ncbi:MAG: PorT family protein [Candidatus Heimdallarchaeota archaeon]|nr:PorT family protein [Candidatus Heimdallarchaeota archaeon]
MNKIACFIVVILAISFAQTPASKLQLGIIGGLNIVSAEVEIAEEGADVSSRTDFGIGGIIDWSMNQTFSIRLEPMYLQKGIGKTEIDIQPGVEWYFNSSYLELPVFVKAEFGNEIRPYILIGPSFGLLLSSEVTAEIIGLTFKGDSKSASENLDVSVVLGGGINYPLDKFSIFLEGRYSYGLTNIIKDGKVELSSGNVTQSIDWVKKTDTLKYRGFQIMTGITFPIG